MANEMIGRFYLKQTSNGNLIGEWSNNDATRVFSESCDLIKSDDDKDYIGEYHSTWQEKTTPIFAKLTITNKPNSGGLFHLEWRGKNNSNNFDGEGMLCDDILIGDYHPV